jgi:hypothetical protein
MTPVTRAEVAAVLEEVFDDAHRDVLDENQNADENLDNNRSTY